jgi:hypothetical protein
MTIQKKNQNQTIISDKICIMTETFSFFLYNENLKKFKKKNIDYHTKHVYL